MPENQHIEYKESWRDEYMKILCGFANAEGGEILIGINDKGKPIGIPRFKILLENLPNKISQKLGIYASVQQISKQGRKVIRVAVGKYESPISFDSKYFIRTGSTTQELKGKELTRFLLKKAGRTWEAEPEERATIGDIDIKTIEKFKKLAKNRIPSIVNETSQQVLTKLKLLDNSLKPNRAAILLFGKDPRKFYISAFMKIGKFMSDTDLVSTDDIEGNLFTQLEKALELLKVKYLLSPVHYESIYRKETLEYPEEVLREAIINALIHKDYTGVHIQMKIYPDKIILWNEGKLPEGITVEMLSNVHPSIPRNELIANTFFNAGLIETWGRGTIKIIENSISAGLPAPLFREAFGGFEIILNKNIYTEKYLKEQGLNQRQVKAVMYVKEKGRITNNEYQKLNETSKRTVVRELNDMVLKNILKKSGKAKNTEYLLTIK
ncbi:MAG: transcriptional regulator [Bacteroidetes bacterium CG02_land_8_20_14_3_00_31_25]|nr:MAG: transcriptional regulator [Bacteroidetes bacterium CG02_land_8_20_14_3_00_31_25]PIY02533.1 MAG: transcriptional regulator [Bacteroidetes bacterium CG_4_10_14_3_um_filter_31_20]